MHLHILHCCSYVPAYEYQLLFCSQKSLYVYIIFIAKCDGHNFDFDNVQIFNGASNDFKYLKIKINTFDKKKQFIFEHTNVL